jgi:hypothetical protein
MSPVQERPGLATADALRALIQEHNLLPLDAPVDEVYLQRLVTIQVHIEALSDWLVVRKAEASRKLGL